MDSGNIVEFRETQGRSLGTGELRTNDWQFVLLAGVQVGMLLRRGELVLTRELSDADRKLVEVAAALETGNTTDASQAAQLEDNPQNDTDQ